MQAMNRRLLRPAMVAEYLGISRAQVYKLGVLFDVRPVKLGGINLYDVRDLDEWIDRQKRQAE